MSNNNNYLHTKDFKVTAIDGKLPVRFYEPKLKDKSNSIQLNNGIISEIEEAIKD